MWFLWFMLCCDVLLPVIMIVSGRVMWKHTPKDINGVLGYRTRRSMVNKDTWNFAHNHCGRLWWKTGWIMLMPTILIHIPLYSKSENVIGIVGVILITIQTGVMITTVFFDRACIKKRIPG